VVAVATRDPLLHGLIAGDDAILAGIARLTKPGAPATVLLSVTERDRAPGIEHLDAAAYAQHGLDICDLRLATAAEVSAAHSTWAKRLRVGFHRLAWLLELRRGE
jgi:hypothetical protein